MKEDVPRASWGRLAHACGRVVPSLLLALLAFGPAPAAPPGGSVAVRISDSREVVTRKIARNLLLRIVKDRSVDCDRYGWMVEVVRTPYHHDSPNLIYSNPGGHGADPSQVYAWHVAEQHFPNERKLKVEGFPYEISLALSDVSIRGQATAACFDAATLTVSWARLPQR
jgi:hypothetical protein